MSKKIEKEMQRQMDTLNWVKIRLPKADFTMGTAWREVFNLCWEIYLEDKKHTFQYLWIQTELQMLINGRYIERFK